MCKKILCFSFLQMSLVSGEFEMWVKFDGARERHVEW